MLKKVNPLISYVMRITKKCDHEKKFEEVYNTVTDMLGKIKEEEILFPLVCWIDETVLSGCWEGKNEWIDRLLQVKYFNINNGGEAFFEKMENSKNKDYYVLMLKLGFKGKYFDNPEALKKLTEKYFNSEKFKVLFPDAYIKKSMKSRKFISSFYNFKTILLLIIITVVLYALYYINLEKLMKVKGLL